MRILRHELKATHPTLNKLTMFEASTPAVSLIQAVVRQEFANLALLSTVCALNNTDASIASMGTTCCHLYSLRTRNPSKWRTADHKPICFRCGHVGHVAHYYCGKWARRQRACNYAEQARLFPCADAGRHFVQPYAGIRSGFLPSRRFSCPIWRSTRKFNIHELLQFHRTTRRLVCTCEPCLHLLSRDVIRPRTYILAATPAHLQWARRQRACNYAEQARLFPCADAGRHFVQPYAGIRSGFLPSRRFSCPIWRSTRKFNIHELLQFHRTTRRLVCTCEPCLHLLSRDVIRPRTYILAATPAHLQWARRQRACNYAEQARLFPCAGQLP
ncbi:uncharacterized protein LOC142771729 [Rhipicephalus microplus]|uniref:uncharacterized protein LOC142771729 n=1 Tax=Rhipicephalus microplus TaxID=6941 RepID=UPI003F6B2E24